jgi:hypothetical protein
MTRELDVVELLGCGMSTLIGVGEKVARAFVITIDLFAPFRDRLCS